MTPLEAPADVLALMPAAVAREHTVFPLHFGGETLTVAAVNDVDALLRDTLSFKLNKRIVLVQRPRGEILAAIKKHFPAEASAEFALELGDEDDDLSVDSMAAADYEEYDDDAYAVAPARGRHAARPAAARRADIARRVRMLNEPTILAFDGRGPRAGASTMWFEVVPDGHRVLRIGSDGRTDVLIGPCRVWRGRAAFHPMVHQLASPGEYLAVRFRDGTEQRLPGPAELWVDPRVHQSVAVQKALRIASKECVVVYSRGADGTVQRRLVHGPAAFVPQPGEWLHRFAWHGSEGGSQGVRKVAKGLVFHKLRLMPDQMYHDVENVRTADDAVLTVRLMIFYELLDVERMLEATHDPIGDFVNAATSDAIDFCGRRDFEQFKKETGKLNELETYPQLAARAAQTGYRVGKVVYRGYGAPPRLQEMHDKALESRTKLELDRATEQQSQDLEDYRLSAQIARSAQRRTEQEAEVEAELGLAGKRRDAERAAAEADALARRERRRLDAEQEVEFRRRADARHRDRCASLKELGVDLTAYLTASLKQGRADQVIELRGGARNAHVHLPADAVKPAGG